MMWNVGRRRTTRAVLGLAAGVLALAACSGGASGTSGSQPSTIAAHKPGENVELTFWSWVPGVDKAVALWNQQNPEVQVKLEKIPSGSSGGYAKMHSALKAGSGAPDLAQVEYQEIPGFLLEKGLVDLSPYGASADQDKFVDWQWQQGAFGDGVYAIPQASGPMGFFYRADLFQKWGIAPPKTWDDFRTAAKTIRQKDPKAYISTFPPGNSAWFTALAWQAGGKWFGSEGDAWTVNMDNPQTQKVADYWDSMIKDDLVKTEPDFANGWYKDLQEGNVVGWVSAQWGDAILSGNAPKTSGKWRVAPMPQWDSSKFTSSNWGGSSTAVLTGSKHPKEAKDFAVWLNSDPKSIDLLIAGGYGWPAAKDAFTGTALDRPYPFFGGQKINDVFATADKAIDRDWSWIPTTASAYQHLNDGFQKAINGQGTFVSAVTDAQAATVADLKSKGLKVATP
jgi:multiple sugar transport system substrate-binding protein